MNSQDYICPVSVNSQDYIYLVSVNSQDYICLVSVNSQNCRKYINYIYKPQCYFSKKIFALEFLWRCLPPSPRHYCTRNLFSLLSPEQIKTNKFLIFPFNSISTIYLVSSLNKGSIVLKTISPSPTVTDEANKYTLHYSLFSHCSIYINGQLVRSPHKVQVFKGRVQ